jgi:hypothetical protein
MFLAKTLVLFLLHQLVLVVSTIETAQEYLIQPVNYRDQCLELSSKNGKFEFKACLDIPEQKFTIDLDGNSIVFRHKNFCIKRFKRSETRSETILPVECSDSINGDEFKWNQSQPNSLQAHGDAGFLRFNVKDRNRGLSSLAIVNHDSNNFDDVYYFPYSKSLYPLISLIDQITSDSDGILTKYGNENRPAVGKDSLEWENLLKPFFMTLQQTEELQVLDYRFNGTRFNDILLLRESSAEFLKTFLSTFNKLWSNSPVVHCKYLENTIFFNLTRCLFILAEKDLSKVGPITESNPYNNVFKEIDISRYIDQDKFKWCSVNLNNDTEVF